MIHSFFVISADRFFLSNPPSRFFNLVTVVLMELAKPHLDLWFYPRRIVSFCRYTAVGFGDGSLEGLDGVGGFNEDYDSALFSPCSFK